VSFKRSGSRYSQKIVPIRLLIAYEGFVDEKEYFHAIKNFIPKRFDSLIQLIPVDKTSTASSPSAVVNDLSAYLKKENIKVNSDNLGFIVIDRDHWSKGTHQRALSTVIQECRQKNIDIICSVPSFDLWLLCHYLDISCEDDTYKINALNNGKTSRNSTFLKSELAKNRNGESYDELISKTEFAIKNASKLNDQVNTELIFPNGLYTSVYKIIEILNKNNIIF